MKLSFFTSISLNQSKLSKFYYVITSCAFINEILKPLQMSLLCQCIIDRSLLWSFFQFLVAKYELIFWSEAGINWSHIHALCLRRLIRREPL